MCGHTSTQGVVSQSGKAIAKVCARCLAVLCVKCLRPIHADSQVAHCCCRPMTGGAENRDAG